MIFGNVWLMLLGRTMNCLFFFLLFQFWIKLIWKNSQKPEAPSIGKANKLFVFFLLPLFWIKLIWRIARNLSWLLTYEGNSLTTFPKKECLGNAWGVWWNWFPRLLTIPVSNECHLPSLKTCFLRFNSKTKLGHRGILWRICEKRKG